MRNQHKIILIRKSDWRDHLGQLDVGGKIILKRH
jgi:hypothetical protein